MRGRSRAALPRVGISSDGGDWDKPARIRALALAAIGAAIETASLDLAKDSELSIRLTGDAQMTELNAKWRGKDRPTNVLSFPGSNVAPGDRAGPILGDIVLAGETIRREAELDGKPFEHHLTHLIVHGFLHLFGYDHSSDDEARIMEALERKALNALGIGDPYQGEA